MANHNFLFTPLGSESRPTSFFHDGGEFRDENGLDLQKCLSCPRHPRASCNSSPGPNAREDGEIVVGQPDVDYASSPGASGRDPSPPPVLGGQGRTPEEIENTVTGLTCLMLAIIGGTCLCLLWQLLAKVFAASGQ